MILFNRQTEVIEAHDPRVAEILELVAVEGIRLRIEISVVLWLEDHGHTVDLRTGLATPIVDELGRVDVFTATPSGNAVNHLLTPPSEREIEQTIDGLFTTDSSDAYTIGEADADDGYECRPLHHFASLALVESYIVGYKAAQAPDGTLQKMIDNGHDEAWYDAELQDQVDGRLDDEYHASGNW